MSNESCPATEVQAQRWNATLPASIFDKGAPGRRGLTFPRWDGQPVEAQLPKELCRAEGADLPSLSEPEVMRHFTQLSTLNHHIERGMYPLGSCTMKYNPRVNEQVVALSGLADLHPEQGPEDIQGLLEALDLLERSLCELTGFAACSLIPAAGAHGEYLGMLVIRAYHQSRGDEDRTEILIPDSAHGTNPASVVIAGLKPRTIKSRKDGRIDLDALRAAVSDKTAGIMITNPNTLGTVRERYPGSVAHHPRGRWPPVHGRRQHERHHGQNPPRRHGLRRGAPEHPQDPEHAAWWWWTRWRAHLCGRGSGAVPARSAYRTPG